MGFSPVSALIEPLMFLIKGNPSACNYFRLSNNSNSYRIVKILYILPPIKTFSIISLLGAFYVSEAYFPLSQMRAAIS